jgi:hypothetical protein
MEMSKENYIKFAHILAENKVHWDSRLVIDLCSYLKKENTNFDWDKFCLAIERES